MVRSFCSAVKPVHIAVEGSAGHVKCAAGGQIDLTCVKQSGVLLIVFTAVSGQAFDCDDQG